MSKTDTISQTLSVDESALMRCVLYFSVFNYPLKEQELFDNSGVTCDRSTFPALLSGLCENGYLVKQGDFYLDPGAAAGSIERRKKGNAGAAAVMDTAWAYSKKISAFPFVRGVCLSGALSKNFFDEKGDIDYFIITKPGRLWICRSLLILRYKLLSARNRKFWCVNYFVSEDNLEIKEKNTFTATEIAFLIPTYNYGQYERLLEQNKWYREQFFNRSLASPGRCIQTGAEPLKKVFEALFTGWGTLLDNWLLRATLRRWQKKFPNMQEEDFELQFRSRKNVCKRHTLGFQNRVLVKWEEKLSVFEREHNISFC